MGNSLRLVVSSLLLRVCFLVSSLFVARLQAAVTMSPLFGDHMVLQQGMTLPIWGNASPGEQVCVQFVGQKVITTANVDGYWRVNLRPVYLRSSPDVLTIDGTNHLQFADVLVGEVWLCAGGSNMAFPLQESWRGEETTEHAHDSELRFFVVETSSHFSSTGKKEATSNKVFLPQKQLQGKWERCTPETAAHFSAVGYFFGRDLRSATGLPIGLIGSYEKETPLSSWLSLKALAMAPSFSGALATYTAVQSQFLKAKETYVEREKKYEEELQFWKKEVEEPYQRTIAAWKIACNEARLRLEAQPLKPEVSVPKPVPPALPDGGAALPSSSFHQMIAPLIPYAIAGAIWYQGESDEGVAAFEYRRLFPRLIRSWRAAWGEGPFPFYFVQLAGHYKKSSFAVDSLFDEEKNINPAWPWIREGQAAALTLPETGMVVASDLGDPQEVVPADKLDIGRRLALLARSKTYGEKIVAAGPVYQSMKKEGSKIRIFFKNTSSGLTVGAPPWSPDGRVPFTFELKGFSIAGSKRSWEEAVAVIEGNSVLVFGNHTEHPEAVRYNWKNFPTGNLYNKEGLPAAPFRTDSDQPTEP